MLELVQKFITYLALSMMGLVALRVLLKPNRFFRRGSVLYFCVAVLVFVTQTFVFSQSVRLLNTAWNIPYYLFALCCFQNSYRECAAAASFYSYTGAIFVAITMVPWRVIGYEADSFSVPSLHLLWLYVLYIFGLLISAAIAIFLLHRFPFWRKLPLWCVLALTVGAVTATAVWDVFVAQFDDLGLILTLGTMICVTLFMAMLLFYKQERKTVAERHAFLASQQRLQLQFYHMLARDSRQLRQFRETLLTDLEHLNLAISTHKIDNAKVLLQTLTQQIYDIKLPFRSGHPPTDAILQSKHLLAQQKGVTLSAAVALSEQCAIQDMDIVCVWANLLDNALQECEAGDCIHIRGTVSSGLMVIEVRNPLHHENAALVIPDFPQPTSAEHGLGLLSVRRTAAHYGGSFTLKAENGVAVACVVMVTELPAAEDAVQ